MNRKEIIQDMIRRIKSNNLEIQGAIFELEEQIKRSDKARCTNDNQKLKGGINNNDKVE